MKIILIGCPGSGKSTLTRRMNEILHYPVLHLDQIYHLDNEHHITREELKTKVEEFAAQNENWIIDGNYKSTIAHRINLCDTVILLDIDTKTCLENAKKRAMAEHQNDMAKGFDISKLNDGFLEFIESFKTEVLPEIKDLLKNTVGKEVITLTNYKEVDKFIENLSNRSHHSDKKQNSSDKKSSL